MLERLHRDTHAGGRALTTLYEAHRAELFGFLVRMTRDRAAAEDLLQDTFLQLVREANAGRMPDSVRPWLYRVAANEAINRSRRGAVLGRLLSLLPERRQPASPEDEMLRSERDAELHVALAELAPDARAALLLAAQGFDGREIAACIARTEGATRTLLSRSRVRLRLALETEEGQA